MGIGVPPNDGNKLVGFLDGYFDKGSGYKSLGTLTASGIIVPKISIPVLNQGMNVRNRIQYHDAPVVSANFSDIHWQNLELLFGIESEDVSAGTESVTDEDVASTDITGGEDHEHGYWVSFVHGHGSESPISDVVVEPDGGGAAFTEGTDYIIDYEGGRISFPSGSSIGDEVHLDIDYKYTTQTGKKLYITGGPIDTTGAFKGVRKFRDGREWNFIIYKVNITGDFDAAFVAKADGESMTLPIEISALEDPNHTDANGNPVFAESFMATTTS
jgi:hypothetical protein